MDDMTDIDQIIDTKNKLNRELQVALSSMEKKNDVKDIREKIGLLKAKVSSIDEIYGNSERESEFTKYAQSLPMEKDVFDEDWNIVGHGVENEVPRTQG